MIDRIYKLLIIFLILTLCSCTRATETSISNIDSHLHYVDFNQETDGFDKLISAMDENSVDRAMICGLPLKKEWNDSMDDIMTYRKNNDANYYYYSATDYKLLETYKNLPKEKKERFYPFICGINTNDKYSAKFIEELFAKYKGDIYGIGEIICKHDKLTKNTYGIEPSADSNTMKVIYDLADAYNVPVLLHNNITEIGDKTPKYLPEMINALNYNVNCKIIWAHGGIAEGLEVDNYVNLIDDLLSDFENLYIDISWKLYDDYVSKNIEEWSELVEKYPDRFVVGTDLAGVFTNYGKEINKFDELYNHITAKTRDKIKCKNFLDLINN